MPPDKRLSFQTRVANARSKEAIESLLDDYAERLECLILPHARSREIDLQQVKKVCRFVLVVSVWWRPFIHGAGRKHTLLVVVGSACWLRVSPCRGFWCCAQEEMKTDREGRTRSSSRRTSFPLPWLLTRGQQPPKTRRMQDKESGLNGYKM